MTRHGGSKVTVVIVNYRTPELAVQCVESLAGERDAVPGLEVIVVDGGSGDGSADKLIAALSGPDSADWVSVLPLEINGGFGWANNQAMLRLLQRDEPPDFIHLLNPDCRIEPGAVAKLRDELLSDLRWGAAGSQLLDADGGEAGSAFRFPSVRRELVRGSHTPALAKLLLTRPVLVEPGTAGTVDWVTGASFMLRSDALRQAGLFDDGFFLYFEEIELMHRLRAAGWQMRHVPASRVWHVGGAATGVNDHVQQAKPRPRYWYEARRRFFTRAYGPVTAVLASLAWIKGHILWELRKLVSRPDAREEVPHELRDLISVGLLPSKIDRTSAVAAWDSEIGRLPFWKRAG